ncbi:MAG: hypothetical protein JWQ29_1616 [Phenylobacterium sp.]|nr:hypothetical protein [Phenylobacterium sp.]
MLKAMLTRWIDGFERQWGYDASYMRDVIATSPASLVKFALGARAADPKAAPPAALFAAGLAGVLAEDCGPCIQLGVDMAVAHGIDPRVVRGVLAGDEAAMGETACLAFRFARASLARDMAAADPLREEIVRRWGEKALVAISLSLVASRMYPTLKYALGHGKSCSRVMVEGVATPVAHVALAA